MSLLAANQITQSDGKTNRIGDCSLEESWLFGGVELPTPHPRASALSAALLGAVFLSQGFLVAITLDAGGARTLLLGWLAHRSPLHRLRVTASVSFLFRRKNGICA